MNRFDWDAAMAATTRRAVLERLEREGARVAASHFPRPGLGQFVRMNGRYTWQPIRTDCPLRSLPHIGESHIAGRC